MTTTGVIILFALITVGTLTFIEIGGLPGREARERNHPHADAISLLGSLGLPFTGVGWMVAMIWARIHTVKIEVVDRADGDGEEAPVNAPKSE